MNTYSNRRFLSTLAVLATIAACAPAMSEPPPPRGGSAAHADVEAIYRARMDSARVNFSPADVTFMTDMIHHHAQALEMARLAPTNGASPSIATLAARIENGQADEVETMIEWLRDRDQPVPEIATSAMESHGGTGHHGHAGHEHAAMPGMLTAAQLAALREARGPAFDRLFLTSMIEHHRGAVVMVNRLFATDGAGQDDVVFRFASDVQVDQTTEIARMELMLSRMSPDEHAH